MNKWVFSLWNWFRMNYSFKVQLTLKEPRGNPPPSTFLVISHPVVIFSHWNFMTFFLQALRSIQDHFFKNRTGGHDAALHNRALGPTKNWPKTDFQWKLHTNRVFCTFLFQDTLSLCFILFIWFIWSKNMCKHTLTHIIAKKSNFCLKK